MVPNLSPTAYIGLYASEHTRRWYTNCLKRYLEYLTDTRIGRGKLDAAWAEYLADCANPQGDLIRFPAAVRGVLAPMTINQYVGCAERYLADACGIELSRQERRLKARSTPENTPISANYELTRDAIAELLRYADERMRAEILIAVSGGLRIGEIVRLTMQDVSIDEDPVSVRIRRENSKNNIARTTYLSAEAVAALRAYYNVRETKRVSGWGRTRGSWEDMAGSSRIFPFSQETEIRRLRHIVRLSKLGQPDPVTGRMNIHFHLFRAWFSTQAGLSGAPKDYIEELMGHEGYLRGAYWRPTAEKKRELYKQMIEPAVMINIPDDYHAIKVKQAKELDELRAANIHNQQMIAILMAQLNDVQRAQTTGIRIAGLPYAGSAEDEDIND